MAKAFPNEYTDNVNFSSTGADVGFGFNASYVKLRNTAAPSVYVTLKSTTGATTSGAELKTSEELILQAPVLAAGFSFAVTSSAGTGLGLKVWALGGLGG